MKTNTDAAMAKYLFRKLSKAKLVGVSYITAKEMLIRKGFSAPDITRDVALLEERATTSDTSSLT